MRRQLLVSRVLSLTALLALGAATASAAPPPGQGPEGEHGKGPAGKPPGAAAPGGDKGPAGKPAGAAPGEDKGKDAAKGDKDAKGDKGDKDAKGEKADDKAVEKGASGQHRGPHAMRAFLEELKSGKLKKEDIKARVKELQDARQERAKEHREELKTKYGALLATPAAKEELEHHARRIAKLERAQLLADTEIKKDKDKIKERITKLITLENERHEKAMAKLKAGPAAAPVAVSPPTPAPAAPAKGGE